MRNTTKKHLISFLTASLMSGMSSAQIIQFFGFQTDNPAALQFIKSNEFQVGGSLVMPRFDRDGVVFGRRGSSDGTHNTDFAFPQLRLAHRFSPKIVASLDISEPVAGFYPFSQSSFTAPAGYDIGLSSASIVPKMSFAVNDKLTLGAAFVATNMYNFRMNFATPLGFLENYNMNGWGYGFQLGAMYQWSQGTYIDFTYISKISAVLSGESFIGSNYTSNLQTNDFIFTPTTYIGRVTKFMSQKWLSVLEVAYSDWGKNKSLDLLNTAFTPAPNFYTPLFWKGSWHFNAFNRYQANDKWGLFAVLIYETSVQNNASLNYTTIPTSPVTYITLGADYDMKEGVKLTAFVGDAIWTPSPHTMLPVGTDVKTSFDWYYGGLNLKVNWD